LNYRRLAVLQIIVVRVSLLYPDKIETKISRKCSLRKLEIINFICYNTVAYPISKQIDGSMCDYSIIYLYMPGRCSPEPGVRFLRPGVAWARLVARVPTKQTSGRVQEPSQPGNLAPALHPNMKHPLCGEGQSGCSEAWSG
jgi:hypothetical protein